MSDEKLRGYVLNILNALDICEGSTIGEYSKKRDKIHDILVEFQKREEERQETERVARRIEIAREINEAPQPEDMAHMGWDDPLHSAICCASYEINNAWIKKFDDDGHALGLIPNPIFYFEKCIDPMMKLLIKRAQTDGMKNALNIIASYLPNRAKQADFQSTLLKFLANKIEEIEEEDK